MEEKRIKKEPTPENDVISNSNLKIKEEYKRDSDNESSEDSELDIDYNRLTLIQFKEKILKNREKKQKNDVSFLKKKRTNPETHIQYDPTTKKLYNTFCPDYKELKTFLEQCTINEINSDNNKNNNENINENEDNSKHIFDPFEFMEKNNIMKPTLSIEDDLCLKQVQFKSHSEIKEVMPSLSAPLMSVNDFILNFDLNDGIIKENIKDEFIQLEKIINTDILDNYQKSWMNDFFKKINKMPLNDIIFKDKKLEIILDLDYTCVFSFVNSTSKKEALFYKEFYPEKNIYVLSFQFYDKKMYSSIIIRKGLKEFVEYVKDFCTFHIRTLGVAPYASKICDILEKYLGIQFKIVKAREYDEFKYNNYKSNNGNKYLDDLNDKNINNNNTIIFDDTTHIWKKDLPNIIQSKKFIDKECGVYSQKEKEKNKSSLENEITLYQNIFSGFYYHKFDNKNPSWKTQTLCSEPRCPFYQYRDKNAKNYNFVYSGEFLNSPKLQFIYMKNVIKIIYYLMYHNGIPTFDAIKLIRLNALYGKYFYLKYLDDEQKTILSDIIKVCGGEIILAPDDSIDYAMKTIFLVCSMDKYVKERNGIQEELNRNKKYILINEKFILDSYYFMTDLGDSYKDNEYNPEYCYCL